MLGYDHFPQQLFHPRLPGLDDPLATQNQSFERGQVIGSTMNLPPWTFVMTVSLVQVSAWLRNGGSAMRISSRRVGWFLSKFSARCRPLCACMPIVHTTCISSWKLSVCCSGGHVQNAAD